MQADWSLLTKELGLWSKAGLTPRLWLRDDDAVAPSKALDRLLALGDRYEVPLVLAVIPAATGEELARHLRDRILVSIAVHGWRHANHAGSNEKKQELGRHRPAGDVVDELSEGLSKLSALHGERLLPMLVPPWNRIDPALLPAISAAGYRAVSSFGDALLDEKTNGLEIINTHVDIMDWSTRRGADPSMLAMHVRQPAREITRSRRLSGWYSHPSPRS